MIMENRFDHFIDSLFLARPPTPSHPPSAQTTRKTQPPYPILSWLSPNRRAGRYEAPSVGVGAGKLLSDDQATTKPVGQLFSLPHTTTGQDLGLVATPQGTSHGLLLLVSPHRDTPIDFI